MTSVIYLNPKKADAMNCAIEAAQILSSIGIKTIFDDDFARMLAPQLDFQIPAEYLGELPSSFDFAISIGGDGTLLKTSHMLLGKNIPLLGINMGRLGFMCSIEKNELGLLSRLASGEFSLSSRMMLSGTVVSPDGTRRIPLPALNDIVVSSSPTSMCCFEVLVDGHTVCHYPADGIILASPTGSTAYALAAGGSIISPNVDAIELVPICAHTLFSRPMLFSSHSVVTLRPYRSRGCRLNASADGHKLVAIEEGSSIEITEFPERVSIIDIKDGSYYEALNSKLITSIKGR